MDMSQLESYVEMSIISPFKISIYPGRQNRQQQGDNDNRKTARNYLVEVEGNPDGSIVRITDDRCVQVHNPPPRPASPT